MDKIIYILRYVSKEKGNVSSAIMNVTTDELALKTECELILKKTLTI